MEYRRKIHIEWYVASDYTAAVVTWAVLFVIRKLLLDQPLVEDGQWQFDTHFLAGLAFFPIGWVVFYFITGSYNSLYKKSRTTELMLTFLLSLLGCFLVSFFFLFNDSPRPFIYYYKA